MIAYLLPSEFRTMFWCEFNQKVMEVPSLLIGFITIVYGIGGFLLLYGFYVKLTKYFLENVECKVGGVLLLSYHLCFRNVLLGFAHNLLRPAYGCLLLALFLIELTSIAVMIRFIAIRKCLIYKFKAWIFVAFPTLRILLQLTFFIDYGKVD